MENKENLDLSKTPEHNEGWLQILRLNDLWKDANYISKTGKLTQWRFTLDVIFRELAREYFKLNDNKSFQDFYNHPYTIYILQIDKDIKTKWAGIKRGQISEVYDLLHEKDMFLRMLQDKVGKGTKYKDDDEGAI